MREIPDAVGPPVYNDYTHSKCKLIPSDPPDDIAGDT
jgi:hypothetical protein